MGNIHVLGFEIANLIAAGEVVERPASVLKELIENAIDSGATEIVAEIKRGGVAMIRVSDNGCGMDKDDLPVAIKRHATSKIRDKEDLDTIMTLGFRGEALAAISSVSSMTIITKTKDAPIGSLLTAEAGDVRDLEEVAAADGTTVVVENLFYNVPARRKFLKKDATEASNVAALVEKVALSRPDIAISLVIDGEERFHTPGDGSLENTIYAVLGKDFAKKIIAVDGEANGIHVHGFVGRSDNVRKNRNLENVFINGRFVKSQTVAIAVERAFTSFIAPECFPACVLFVDMNPLFVDVNVHPAKLEVKFADERPIFEVVYHSVKRALETAEYRPDLKIGEKKAAPAPSFGKPVVGEQVRMSAPQTEKTPPVSVPPRPAYRAPAEELKVASGAGSFRGEEKQISPDASLDLLKKYREAREEVPKMAPEARIAIPVAKPETKAEVLPEKEAPVYRYVGEAFDCYVMIEYEGDLLIIDKHAAHERVIFEDLKRSREADGRILSQTLMLPLDISLTPDERAAAEEYAGELASVGFTFNLTPRGATVDAIPDAISAFDAEALFLSMADDLAAGRADPHVTEAVRREKQLYQIACKAAIKGGRKYDRAVIDWLIGKVLALPDITVCPHGRPIAYKLTKRELDRQFDRIK